MGWTSAFLLSLSVTRLADQSVALGKNTTAVASKRKDNLEERKQHGYDEHGQ